MLSQMTSNVIALEFSDAVHASAIVRDCDTGGKANE
jgi:hypothetical protein